MASVRHLSLALSLLWVGLSSPSFAKPALDARLKVGKLLMSASYTQVAKSRGLPTPKQLQSSATHEIRSRRAKASTYGHGAYIGVTLGKALCGEYLSSIAATKNACLFTFTKSFEKDNHHICSISARRKIPLGTGFLDVVEVYAERYGAEYTLTKGNKERSARWKFQIGNNNYLAALYEAKGTYRFELSNVEQCRGGTTLAFRARRAHVRNLVSVD